MMFLWSYLFIFFAAFFNACMDAWENENYFESIFKNWNQKKWYKRVSWQYAKKIFGYRLDGWHGAKSCMIICLMVAVILFKPHHQLWVHFISMGLIWNGTFTLFYHRIFKIK